MSAAEGAESRVFELAHVLGVTTGVAMRDGDIDGIYALIAFMIGEPVQCDTHAASMGKPVAEAILRQEPDLAACVYPEGRPSPEAHAAWLADAEERYGVTRVLTRPAAMGAPSLDWMRQA